MILTSVQLLSRVWLFAMPWIAASQASQLLELSQTHVIELVMSSNHLILCHPLLFPSIFPSIRVFFSESVFASGGQSVGTSASTSVLPMNIQGWFPLELAGLISLQSRDSLEFFPTSQFESISSSVLSISISIDQNHFAVRVKLTQYCKSSILQLKKKKIVDFMFVPYFMIGYI